MRALWENHKKKILIAGGVLVAALAVGLAVWLLGGEDAPLEVASPWPVAERERVLAEPERPAVWPLTGEPVTGEESPAAVRIVAVKIENSPAARPQSGLQAADVVYESVTEGGITRFNALYHSETPSTVGPVRSARLSDTYIVPQYAALFGFSGSSSAVAGRLRGAGIENLSQDAGVSAPYSRVSGRRAPHNLFLDIERLREEAARRGMDAQQQIRPLEFAPNIDVTPAVGVLEVPFSPANRVTWEWDEGSGRFSRTNNGSRHVDSATGEALTARNVVVMWAEHVSAGGGTFDIRLAGSGTVAVFRDGARIDGTWEAAADTPPVFTAADGSRIRLAPGNTWIQVVSPAVAVSVR